MDVLFNDFLDEFGYPTYSKKADPEVLEHYRDRLPNKLLEYWQEYGFCGFLNGLFWIVNPREYEYLLGEWIEGTTLVQNDTYYVIARDAFGCLYLWGEKTGYKFEIDCLMGWIIEKKGNSKEITKGKADHALQMFFSVTSVEDVDSNDEHGNPLFERAIKKFGPLGPDEIFGFEPALVVGGKALLKNLVKVNLHVHLSILLQLGERKILDHAALVRTAFEK